MSDSTIQIKIGAVELTCREAIARESLENVIDTLRTRLPELMAGEDASSTPSAAALLEGSQARTYGEKAGVVAYWLEEHQGRADWRSGDIVDVLVDSGESAPANITDALNQKLKKGLFEVNDRRWRLTGEGRGWVRYSLLNHRDEDGEQG